MKHRNQTSALFITPLLGVMACLVGCTSTGVVRSQKATTTMQTVAEEIVQIVV